MTSDPTSEAIRGHPRPSEAEVLPEGLDVFLGVLGGHVDGVWRAKRAAGGPASEASLPPEASQVATEGSGLRVYLYFVCLFFTDSHSL